jgi:UDP-glucose 4-epimerase
MRFVADGWVHHRRAGFIGLLDAGEDVLVLDDLSTGFRWALPAEAKFIEGNVGDYELVLKLDARQPLPALECCAQDY